MVYRYTFSCFICVVREYNRDEIWTVLSVGVLLADDSGAYEQTAAIISKLLSKRVQVGHLVPNLIRNSIYVLDLHSTF